MPKPEAAVYYFPGYHPDPRNDVFHGKDWTEWELLRRAEPRWDGHRQPRVPAWGPEDESDPEVMARKARVAADHGISAFLWDWYWYDDDSYLEGALERGFLGMDDPPLKFALMWANHHWLDFHPARRSAPAPRLMSADYDRKSWDAACEYIVEHYLSHPAYWRVDGALFLTIYEVNTLMQGLGGQDPARDALEGFREKVRSAGLGDLHLNSVVRGKGILPVEKQFDMPDELVTGLGFDSLTSYVWLHHHPLPFPRSSYREMRLAAEKEWPALESRYSIPYLPHVTMGWDSSPRTSQSDVYDDLGYPWLGVLDDNTPEEFEAALEAAARFVASTSGPQIVTINAFNEWTEGSYLEPDVEFGLAYLQAVQRVFGEPR